MKNINKNNIAFKDITDRIKKNSGKNKNYVNSFEFELSLFQILKNIPNQATFYDDANLFMDEILAKDDENKDAVYGIFIVVQYLLRRNRDYNLIGNLFNKYENKFVEYSSISYFKALYLTMSKQYTDYNAAKELLELGKTSYLKNVGHPGSAHSFAVTFCSISEFFPEERKEINDMFLEEANEAMKSAMEYYSSQGKINAKFLSTQGRLLASKGDYIFAIAKIEEAIRHEDSNRTDYSSVINQYDRMIGKIELESSISKTRKELADKTKKLEKQTNEIEEELGRIPKKEFSILAIFITVATFAIGGVSISKSFTPLNAAFLLVITFASLTVFLSLILIPVFKNRKTTILASTVAVLGVIAITLLMSLW